MQKAPTASVSSGQVAPTIIGPDRDIKEMYMVSGLVLFLAVVVAGFWYYSQSDEAAHTNRATNSPTNTQLATTLTAQTDATPLTASVPAIHIEAMPVATRSSDVLHDDIFFEINRKGLTDDGMAALQRHAEFLKNESDWGVLVQGYTDQQGSMSFNKILGLKRAETVKQHLMSLGVSETAIRTVSLGEEGALCIDNSDTCRRTNRRVHLELRRIGQEHMVIPAIAPPAVMDTVPDSVDGISQTDDSPVAEDSLLESTTASPESVPAPPVEQSILQPAPQ
ncbi:MAG TPA: OmpA family protein [Nitrospiraceae bacterium]|nr:OmpA family protein [Nitrospiraceae bacterium]